MELTLHQLMAMRSLIHQGWPNSLLSHLLTRCGLEEEGWQALVHHNFVFCPPENDSKIWLLTSEGRREYRKQKKGKYF